MTAKEAREMTESNKKWCSNNRMIEKLVDHYVKEAANNGLAECLIPASEFPSGVSQSLVACWLDEHGFRHEPRVTILPDSTAWGLVRSEFAGYLVMW